MRNWNPGPWSCRLWCFRRLPDYLWGIETSRHYFRLNSSCASRLPMRNWNCRCFCRCRVRGWASRLPMRNWNSFFRELFPHPEGLPDYLWGIETPNAPRRAKPIAFRFQTTYEELKLSCHVFSSPDVACFQTTYEELKRFWFISHTSCIKLPDYLWGIETFYPKHINHNSLQTASRLPMRNWNFLKNGDSHQIRLPASRLPMRNWNVLLWTVLKRDCLQLPDYLWGIETETARMRYYSGRRLPDYLWGIETVVCQTDWKVD